MALLFLLLLFHSPSSSTATKILISGEILPANTQLSIPNNTRNLMNIHSNINCTLALTDRGQLLIRTPNGSAIWSSSPPSNRTGLYAALLRPDGHVAVYGPSLWSTATAPLRRSRSDVGVAEMANSLPPNIARNHMFSSQVLYDNSKLASGGGHALVMKDDCSLELVNYKAFEGVVWESGTKGRGRNCFVRLDQRGQLAIVDDRFKVLWASKRADADGVFVLVVQNDGQAAVYGPEIWSTDSSD